MANSLWNGFLIIYAVMKDTVMTILSKISSDPWEKSCKALSILLTISMIVSAWIFMTPFFIFRAFLYVVLKIKYGKTFGGFLRGTDSFFELAGGPIVINAIVIYRLDDEGKSKHKELAKKFVRTLHESIYKFGASVAAFFGYYYYIKDRVKADDVLEFIEGDDADYLTQSSIYDYIEQNCEKMKDNRMWKASVFLQPIKWDEDSENGRGKQYAMVVTIRHCMCDGPALMNIIRKLVKLKEETANFEANPRPVANQQRKMTLDNVYVCRNPFTNKGEGDILRIKGKSEWYVAASREAKPKYIPIIKRIKEKLNSSFMDVINSAIYSSVLDYIAERGVKSDVVTASTIIRPNHKQDLQKFTNEIYDPTQITNDFSATVHGIPFEPEERSMKNKILSLRRLSKALMGGVDPHLFYGALVYICTYLPACFAEFIVTTSVGGGTLATSNMVGCEKVTCFDCVIDDVSCCVPNPILIGFMFSIFTYDGRLSITVCCRRGYVHNREELQGIANNAFRYLDEANAEIL